MALSKEIKVAELIANSVEDHYFNPAVVGRFLAQQPYYTVDRVVEMLLWVLEKNARRHDTETNQTSEGLMISKMLDKVVDQIQNKYTFNNIKFPPTLKQSKAFIDSLPALPADADKPAAGWYRDQDTKTHITIDHPFI